MARRHRENAVPSTPKLDRKVVKRYAGVAGVVLPAVMPLVYQGAAILRDRWDQERARRLGVPLDRLGEFSGRGAALHARLARLSDSLDELARGHSDQAGFVETSQARLADLAASVRATEQMPAARRRETHRSIASELDGIEQELLRRYELG